MALNRVINDILEAKGVRYKKKYIANLGIDKNKVTCIFNGDFKRLNYYDIIKLAKGLGVSSDELLGLNTKVSLHSLIEYDAEMKRTYDKVRFDLLARYGLKPTN